MAKRRITSEQAFKKRFVERRLAPMLEDMTDGYVSQVDYRAVRDDETVVITLDASAVGGMPTGRQLLAGTQLEVNVSLDSKAEIVNDVLKALGKVI